MGSFSLEYFSEFENISPSSQILFLIISSNSTIISFKSVQWNFTHVENGNW